MTDGGGLPKRQRSKVTTERCLRLVCPSNHSAAQPVCLHLAHLGYLQTVVQPQVVRVLEKVAVTCGKGHRYRHMSIHTQYSSKTIFCSFELFCCPSCFWQFGPRGFDNNYKFSIVSCLNMLIRLYLIKYTLICIYFEVTNLTT